MELKWPERIDTLYPDMPGILLRRSLSLARNKFFCLISAKNNSWIGDLAKQDRHHPSGYAFGYDPTGRCHKREFLLKFAKDKQRWMYWLFEAKKRFGLCVLNFTVTSNHVHLLIYDTGNGNETIPKSIQLVAGKTGQEFNSRKGRNGAFWQDRYHATAVATDDHLIRCMVISDRAVRLLQLEDTTIYWQNGPVKAIGDVPRIYGLQNPNYLIPECHASKSPYRRPWSAAPYHCEGD